MSDHGYRYLTGMHWLGPVVCMFCLHGWLALRPEGTLAKCPRCGAMAGAQKFGAVMPERFTVPVAIRGK